MFQLFHQEAQGILRQRLDALLHHEVAVHVLDALQDVTTELGGQLQPKILRYHFKEALHDPTAMLVRRQSQH